MSYIERIYWNKRHNIETNISRDLFKLKFKNHWIFSDFVEKNVFSNLWRIVPRINVGHLYKQVKNVLFYTSFIPSSLNQWKHSKYNSQKNIEYSVVLHKH